jgi:hypothetical protein
MIVYLVTEQHQYTVESFLHEWQPALAKRVKILAYEALPQTTRLPLGSYIFSDIELLGPASTEMAVQVWDTLSRAGRAVRLYNHPRRVMRRDELLRTMFESGQNRFEARHPHDGLGGLKFPVFLRNGRDHAGPSTLFLHNARELRQALWVQRLRRVDMKNMLAIEFCDTADETGLYRKYASYVMGDRVIPRHLFFSNKWVQKYPDRLSAAQAAEQMAYLQTNPHCEQLQEIFRTARIDYGRIDYSLLDGRIQVWEINTNPTIIHSRSKYSALAHEAQDYFVNRLTEAWAALEPVQAGEPDVPFHLDAGLVRRVKAEWRAEANAGQRYQDGRRRLMKIPLFWWGKYDYRE